MFYDWLKAYQDYPFDLPKVSETFSRHFDTRTGEQIAETTPAFLAEGSYCTTFRIHVAGRRITVDGNPSRINRLDNVFGIETLDGCMRVINSVLAEFNLPPMTPCKTLQRLQDGSAVADGAVFQRLDLTSNFYVGQGNERAFLRGISSQRFRNSIGYLYPDGNTTVWTPKGGEKAGRLVTPPLCHGGPWFLAFSVDVQTGIHDGRPVFFHHPCVTANYAVVPLRYLSGDWPFALWACELCCRFCVAFHVAWPPDF